jgi:Tol biopolymer transport system component
VALQATETPLSWPAERLVFAHLEKIWLADNGPPYALTVGESPMLSPNGQRVAYLLPDAEAAGLRQVYVLDLRTKELTLASGPSAPYSRPVWAPDSQSIAYTNGAVLVVADLQTDTQVVVATDVANIGGSEVVPAWTSDSQYIIAPLTRLGPPELFAIHLADGQAARVSYTGGYTAEAPYVVLSEDTDVALRDTVLYTNLADGGTLWAAGIDGTGRHRVLLDVSGVVGKMLLSPDGRRLAGLRKAANKEGYLLWVVDLTTEQQYQGGTLSVIPDMISWGKDNQALYWVSEARVYSYAVASGKSREVAELPPPSPTPTATPLPVPDLLVYYLDGQFYEVEPYGEVQYEKTLAESLVVTDGYSLRGDAIAFPFGADIYTLDLKVGAIAERLYSFQSQGLQEIEIIWSLQGNSLFYAATYEQEEETSFNLRIDLGTIQENTSRVHRFAFLADRTGATPLLYDEERGEAVILPRGEGTSFFHLEVYDVESGQLKRILPVEGEQMASVSPNWGWAVSSGYDVESGRGFLRTFSLTTEVMTQTFLLPEGTFTWGPVRWSPDGEYVAFIPLKGDPYKAGPVTAQGIWVLQPATMEARMVIPIEDPRAYLVGWR